MENEGEIMGKVITDYHIAGHSPTKGLSEASDHEVHVSIADRKPCLYRVMNENIGILISLIPCQQSYELVIHGIIQ